MKGQGTPVTNVSKEQLESPGEELAESWRHQQQAAPSYAPPISSAADPYSAAGYYGTAGTAAFQYQAFGVGDGTWSTNGTDPMTFLGGYAQPDTYGMEGVFGPSTTAFSTTFGQPTSATFNYFHGNGDYSTWGGPLGRTKQYDDYYRPEGLYVPDGLKAVEAGVQGLTLADSKLDKELKSQQHEQKEMSGQPKKTWATIASQPAKPQPPMQSSGLKKKGPGMPPPPIIPGKHNMDIGTWETAKNGPSVAQPPPQVPPPKPQPVLQPVAMPQQQPPPGPPVVTQPPWAGSAPPRAPPPRPQPQLMLPTVPMPALPPQPPLQAPTTAHPVLDKLRTKNNYNPTDFDLSARDARFFVIKSYSEDDIHRSIKYEIWCSTEHGNKRLDTAYRERSKDGQGVVYLFFSVNGSGHFCGMAQMVSAVDYKSNSSVWAQDKWKGQFKVRWIYVKDVPNMQLRHIRLENNENKPVTNSRDTQEIPHVRGVQVLRLMHGYRHSTSIFDDFIHYEKRQEEEDLRKVPDVPGGQGQGGGGGGGGSGGGGGYKDSHQHGHQGGGGYEGGKHQGYEKHDSYSGGGGGGGGGGGNKGHYNRDHGGGFNREHGNYSKDHGGFHKDHGNFQKEQGGGYNKDHGNGDGYSGGGGGYKGHRGGGGGDRDQHGGGYREHRDQSGGGGGGGGGYRSHHSMPKERGEGSSRGGRGRGRPN